jgi:hypothetical protein
MTIEIRELIIKTTVSPKPSDQPSPVILDSEKKDTLIQECVDQVMEILKEKSER